MNFVKNSALALVPVLIVCAAIAVHWRTKPPAYIAQNLSAIHAPQISQLILRQDGKLIHLSKSEKNWTLKNYNDYPVDPVLAENILRSLNGIKTNGVQAWGKEKIAESNLDPESPGAMRLQLRDDANKIAADWVLGREIGYQEFLARETSSDQIQSLHMPQTLKADLKYWIADFWLGADRLDWDKIAIGLDEQQSIQLARADPAQQAWKIENLPRGRELRADSDVVKIPNLLVNELFTGAVRLETLPVESAQRWRSRFTAGQKIELAITQARANGKTYTHFAATALGPDQQQFASRFNAAHGTWAYEMSDEFNNLLSLRMPALIKQKSPATS